MHIVADEVAACVKVPVIHLVHELASTIKKQGCKTVALLATKYVMQMEFYKKILNDHDITVLIPSEEDIAYINHAIYYEFSKNIFTAEAKGKHLQIIEGLRQQGAEGVVLGCTEIPIMIKPDDCILPLFDTARIHAAAAVEFALGD